MGVGVRVRSLTPNVQDRAARRPIVVASRRAFFLSPHLLSTEQPSPPRPTLMPLWLFWLLLGLIAGSLAKFLVPGRDPAGCIFTILLGVVGSFVGGFIGTQLGWGKIDQGELELRSIAIATFGAMVL